MFPSQNYFTPFPIENMILYLGMDEALRNSEKMNAEDFFDGFYFYDMFNKYTRCSKQAMGITAMFNMFVD